MEKGIQTGAPDKTRRHESNPYGPAATEITADRHIHAPLSTAMAGTYIVVSAKPDRKNWKYSVAGPINNTPLEVYKFMAVPVVGTKCPSVVVIQSWKISMSTDIAILSLSLHITEPSRALKKRNLLSAPSLERWTNLAPMNGCQTVEHYGR